VFLVLGSKRDDAIELYYGDMMISMCSVYTLVIM
jgi:hypothetical protein